MLEKQDGGDPLKNKISFYYTLKMVWFKWIKVSVKYT